MNWPTFTPFSVNFETASVWFVRSAPMAAHALLPAARQPPPDELRAWADEGINLRYRLFWSSKRIASYAASQAHKLATRAFRRKP